MRRVSSAIWTSVAPVSVSDLPNLRDDLLLLFSGHRGHKRRRRVAAAASARDFAARVDVVVHLGDQRVDGVEALLAAHALEERPAAAPGRSSRPRSRSGRPRSGRRGRSRTSAGRRSRPRRATTPSPRRPRAPRGRRRCRCRGSRARCRGRGSPSGSRACGRACRRAGRCRAGGTAAEEARRRCSMSPATISPRMCVEETISPSTSTMLGDRGREGRLLRSRSTSPRALLPKRKFSPTRTPSAPSGRSGRRR